MFFQILYNSPNPSIIKQHVFMSQAKKDFSFFWVFFMTFHTEEQIGEISVYLFFQKFLIVNKEHFLRFFRFKQWNANAGMTLYTISYTLCNYLSPLFVLFLLDIP